ncbi:MAG: hypothetical protein M1319_01635 [Chloroflexi bacterium]|nr:hypothetical protein [Chloroflexota bacterium]
MDLAKTTTEEENRKRQELITTSLQNQIEELRRHVKDAQAKAAWVEEGHKQITVKIAELASDHEQLRQDKAQRDQARSLEDQRTKKAIVDLQERAEQPMKLIRLLQSQVQDFGEQWRKDREQVGISAGQLEELRQRQLSMQARMALFEESSSRLEDVLDEMREKMDEQKRAITRAQDAWQIDIQRFVRQGEELDHKIEDAGKSRLDVAAKVQWLEEQRKADRLEIERVATRLDSLEMNRDQTLSAVQRIAEQVSIGDNTLQERLEQYRVLLQNELSDLGEALESRLDRISSMVEAFDDRYRELDSRLGLIPGRFHELERRDEDITGRLLALDEERVLRRMEQLQLELDEIRSRRG